MEYKKPIQRKVAAILAMELPKPKPKPEPVSIHKIISILENFDKKIDVAIFLSK